MAEKQTAGHAALLTLTYRNNIDGDKPQGAVHFRYQHVQTFLSRLRSSYARIYEARNEISYICAGERGSNRDRVHWHIILFSAKPILALGDWSNYRGQPIDAPRIGNPRRLDHWSMWDHGTVDTIIPDQAGMAYVLKYALKDQFNVVKSRGKHRSQKAELHGASMFRMSKKPPIGWRYLEQRLNEYEQMRTVPVHAHIDVPGYSGFWYPTGVSRDYFLQRLHEINKLRRLETGRDCPGWSTLLSRVSQQERDWESLVYGQDPEKEEREVSREDIETFHQLNAAQIAATCGATTVCAACYARSSPEGRADQRAFHSAQVQDYVTDTEGQDGEDLAHWFARKRIPNPHCHFAQTRRCQKACSAR